MKKLLIVTIFLLLGYSSYSQTTPISVIERHKKPILKTDSTITLKNNLSSRKPGHTSSNIRICAPSRANLMRKPPLYVIKYGKREERSSESSFLNLISPTDIEAIYVVKTSAEAAKYGDDGKNGVILITLKSNKTSEYKKKFKKFNAQKK